MEEDKLVTNIKKIMTEKETNLLPENIRKDKTIFGVTGTYQTNWQLEYEDNLQLVYDILLNFPEKTIIDKAIYKLEKSFIPKQYTRTHYIDSGVTQHDLQKGFTIITTIRKYNNDTTMNLFGNHGYGGNIVVEWQDKTNPQAFNFAACAGQGSNREVIIQDADLPKNEDAVMTFIYEPKDTNATLKVYINNELIGQNDNCAKMPDNTASIRIGVSYGSRYFNGVIYDFYIWDRVLSEDEISKVNQYEMYLVEKRESRDNTFNRDWFLPNIEYCNGTSSSFLATTHINQSEMVSGYTLAMRINPEEWSNYRGLMGYHMNTDGICICQYDNNNQINISHLGYNRENMTIILSPEQLPIGEWSILIIVYNGNKLIAYLNGIKIGETIDGIGLNVYQTFRVGRAFADNNNRYFKGTISNLELYLRALSEKEILEIYKRFNN